MTKSGWFEFHRFSDSNITGDGWEWVYAVRRDRDSRLSLKSRQELASQGRHFQRTKRRLVNGAALYEAFSAALAEVGYDIDDLPIEEITSCLTNFDPKVAADFFNAEVILPERTATKERKDEAIRERKLRPFRALIDEYVKRFSETPLRFPGGGSVGNEKLWATRFLENYVLENGELPQGRHRIVVKGPGVHYSGGEHEFLWELAKTAKVQAGP